MSGRCHAIGHDLSWLFSKSRYPREFIFAGLAAVGMIESAIERETYYTLFIR
jgi:hypothetical protein